MPLEGLLNPVSEVLIRQHDVGFCLGRSKLALNIAMGKRDQVTTDVFIEGLRQATSWGEFQITTDGIAPHKSAVSTTLSDRADYAMLVKVYRNPRDGWGTSAQTGSASMESV